MYMVYVTLGALPMCSGSIGLEQIVPRWFTQQSTTPAGGCNSLFNICSNRRLNHRIEVLNGILEDECTALLYVLVFPQNGNRDQEL